MFVNGSRTVKGRPDGLSDKEAHGVNETIFVAGEAVVDSFRERHEVTLFDVDANPTIVQVAHVKVATAAQDVTDLFGVVNVLG